MSSNTEFQIINPNSLISKNEYLWRYMDLFKFIDFMRNKSLPFARMDLFEDPLEGIPLKTILSFAEPIINARLAQISISDLLLDDDLLSKFSPEIKEQVEKIHIIQKRTYVSCWFKSESESMAMWNLYSNPSGVVIRFNTKYLIDIINQSYKLLKENNYNIVSGYCGNVHYQSFSTIKPFQDNEKNKTPRVGLRKEKSYEHEKEVRFVINLRNIEPENLIINLPMDDFNFNRLQIISHPKMKHWQFENLKWILKNESLDKFLKQSVIKLRNS
jgi:hypothetical protein